MIVSSANKPKNWHLMIAHREIEAAKGVLKRKKISLTILDWAQTT
jgi:hypothetical protein